MSYQITTEDIEILCSQTNISKDEAKKIAEEQISIGGSFENLKANGVDQIISKFTASISKRNLK